MQALASCHFARYDLHSFTMTLEETIGQKIRQLRRKHVPELSQEKLAEMAGLSRQTIYEIEKGKSKRVMFSSIAKVADALSVSLNDIYNASMLVAEEPAEYGGKKNRGTVGKSTSEMVPAEKRKRAG